MARKKEPSRFGALLTGAALGAATAAGIAYWLNQSPQSKPAQMRRSRALDRALQRARNESAAPLQTGRAILRTIVVGERDPHKLAALRNYRCKKDEDEIAKAMTGTLRYAQDKPGGRNLSSFILKHSLEMYDFYTSQIEVWCAAPRSRRATAPDRPFARQPLRSCAQIASLAMD